jgi:hypothetical protein
MTTNAVTTNGTQTPASAVLPAVSRGGAAVPWATVLPLAAVLAYADGYWIVSERGAVGAIERTQEPFVSWLRESTLILPIFVAVVLAALTVALTRFGPTARGGRAVAATSLLVVAAGTAAGIAALAASAAYDYRLESDQLQLMNSMHGICVADCLAQAQQSTLSAQLKAVLIVSGFILATNLVLAGWVVALSGGRLHLTSTRRQSAIGPQHEARGRAQDLRLIVVGTLLGSAVIHAAVIPNHLAEWPAAAAFFILLSIAELVIGVLLLARANQTGLLVTAAAMSAGSLVIWCWSRAVGLPFGPAAGAPDAVGVADVVCSALEIVTIVVAVRILRNGSELRRRPAAIAHTRWLTLVAIIAATAIGIAGTAPGWFDGADSQSEMIMTN